MTNLHSESSIWKIIDELNPLPDQDHLSRYSESIHAGFCGIATREAGKLAPIIALIPVTKGTVNILIENLCSEMQESHFAEIALSCGLRKTDKKFRQEYVYEFPKEVADRLLNSGDVVSSLFVVTLILKKCRIADYNTQSKEWEILSKEKNDLQSILTPLLILKERHSWQAQSHMEDLVCRILELLEE